MERTVIQGDALAWLAANPAGPGTSVITSLPDVSELAGETLQSWRRWFVDTAHKVIEWVPDDGVSIFFQSDVRQGAEVVHKGYLVLRAAEDAGAKILWHKIVCRRPPGTIAQGRPSYSHMICVTRGNPPAPVKLGPDILPEAGHMGWSRAMGENACRVACRFLQEETRTRVVVDPFCGTGAALAMANHFGFAAIGVDRSPRRCREARVLAVTELAPGMSDRAGL